MIGFVPPPGITVARPSQLLLHLVADPFAVSESFAGWVITAVVVAVQPPASVIVTIYVPALKPVMVLFVEPVTVFVPLLQL